MWENDAHGTRIHNLLNVAIAALVGHPDERGDAYRQCCVADVAGIGDGESRVLQVDEQTIEARILCESCNQGVCHKPNTEGLGASS